MASRWTTNGERQQRRRFTVYAVGAPFCDYETNLTLIAKILGQRFSKRGWNQSYNWAPHGCRHSLAPMLRLSYYLPVSFVWLITFRYHLTQDQGYTKHVYSTHLGIVSYVPRVSLGSRHWVATDIIQDSARCYKAAVTSIKNAQKAFMEFNKIIRCAYTTQ